ncbi:MAG: L,D-transpeptidase [Gaiellaceae bacterium]
MKALVVGICLLSLLAGALAWIGGPQTIRQRAIGGVAAARTQRCGPETTPTNTPTRSLAAVARMSTAAYRKPGAGVVARFGLRNQDRFRTVFAVLAVRRNARCEPVWYRVRLPIRPNGATGWVSARTVVVSPVDTRIVIHVRARRLELLRAGHVIFRSPISTGAPDTPTPIGTFYVKERLVPADANGPWGPAALGTSAYSPVLRSWTEGGPVGIHGTDDPTAIGRPVSHGCIRLPNAAMRRLFGLTPAGTPILIER